MFRIVLACEGVPPEAGPQGAIDIAEEFTHRPWHKCVTCRWTDGKLLLEAENDFDAHGEATIDEFSDAIAACLQAFDGSIKLVSVGELPSDAV